MTITNPLESWYCGTVAFSPRRTRRRPPRSRTDTGPYSSIEKKRAIERLFQISIETVIDITNILITDLKLGLPENEDEAFKKLNKEKIISKDLMNTLQTMKGFRNILVHKYGEVNDELAFENLDNLGDFDSFITAIITFIKKQ